MRNSCSGQAHIGVMTAFIKAFTALCGRAPAHTAAHSILQLLTQVLMQH